jgi:peptidyl-prolyl cis-trans isomerase D
MIEWMQRHKKWLIVTIWVSTIAFVGAGFVGWGSYDYGKSDSTVAIVGNKEVPLKDLQSEYSNLYNQYQQMLGENFNQELAKQFKLEEAALQRVIQRYLILNYADDLGLMATDKDVAAELVKINSFFKDGKFDKNTYISVLKQNRKSVSEFEEQLKSDILVNKVQDLLQTSLQKNELENISRLILSEDEVSLNIVTEDTKKLNYSDEDLKKYWDTHKNTYKSPNGFEIEYSKIENIENKTKKEMRKTALRAYLKLKKEQETFKNKEIIYATTGFLNAEDLKTVSQSKNGTVLKPIYKDNNYFVIKLIQKVAPQVLAYNEVKTQVKNDFILEAKANLLQEKAKKIKENFSGKNLGYIGRGNIPNITGLNASEKEEFIKHLFSATKTLNELNLGSKILVYKITNSKFAAYDSSKDESVGATVGNLKAGSLSSSLLAKLATQYEVQSFMGNE